MPKAILEFQLPEEDLDFQYAQKGANYFFALEDIDEWLRKRIKYGDLSAKESEIYEHLRQTILTLRRDREE